MALAAPRTDRLQVARAARPASGSKIEEPDQSGSVVSKVAELRRLAGAVAPVALAKDRILPVLPELEPLVGSGLRRGMTVTVSASKPGLGATSLALSLAAAATKEGSWCAVVGGPAIHAPAAAAIGIDLARLAMVPEAETWGHWPTVVGALVDAIDVVIAVVPPDMRMADMRKLSTRAKERGCVLVPLGSWAEGADLRLTVTGARWSGLGQGHGYLTRREIEIAAEGRRAFARRRAVSLELELELANVG